MRDWPESDQDTWLDILETSDIGDYEEAQEYQDYEYEEAQEYQDYEEALAELQNICSNCGATGLSPSNSYCESCQYMYYEVVDEHWEEFCIAKLNADAAQARSDILQAKANIARIKANIAVFKSQIAYSNFLSVEGTLDKDLFEHELDYYNNYLSVEVPPSHSQNGTRSRDYYNNYLSVEGTPYYTDAENKLVDEEANLVEAKTILTVARTIGSAHAAVAAAHNYVKYAEAKVQIKEDAKNRTIEFAETFNSKFLDEKDAVGEGEHIEFVNALIELAEAKDALDLTETLLAKTPSLSSTHNYGFASHEPHCPTSDLVVKDNPNRYGVVEPETPESTAPEPSKDNPWEQRSKASQTLQEILDFPL